MELGYELAPQLGTDAVQGKDYIMACSWIKLKHVEIQTPTQSLGARYVSMSLWRDWQITRVNNVAVALLSVTSVRTLNNLSARWLCRVAQLHGTPVSWPQSFGLTKGVSHLNSVPYLTP